VFDTRSCSVRLDARGSVDVGLGRIVHRAARDVAEIFLHQRFSRSARHVPASTTTRLFGP
jgi:hypothetical protein